jgi:hypothetical protein
VRTTSNPPSDAHRLDRQVSDLRHRTTLTGRRTATRLRSWFGNRRNRWRLLVAVVVLLAYPVLGTVALTFGVLERLVGSEDLKIELVKPAWTLWPGHIHVAGATVLVNGDTQFKLQAKNLLVHVQLFPLVKKHLHVTTLSAHDVRYFMRVQVKDTKGIEKRVAAYPKLDDLPGDPTLVEKKAQANEPRESDFTVEVDGIDVDVAELWFMEYHYVGQGTLKGSFLVGPHRMRVGTSVQNIGPGELRFGATEPVIANLHGKIEAAIPDVNPEEHADESFLELVTSDIRLAGQIVGLSPLSAYTGKVRLTDGEGPFETRILLSKGSLGNDTRFVYTTKKVGIRTEGFGVDTDWNFEAKIADHDDDGQPKNDSAKGKGPLPRLRSSSAVTYVSASNRRGDIFTTQVQNHEEKVVLSSNRLGRMTDINHAHLQFPKIVTSDLRDLGALTSEGSVLTSKAGEGRASLTVDVDEHHVAKGAFRAAVDGMQLNAADMAFAADGAIDGRLVADLDKKWARMDDFSLALTHVGMRAGDETVRDWWTRVEIPSVAVAGVPPTRVDGRISASAKSAEPFLKALAEKDQIADLIPKLTSLPNIRLRANFRKNGDATDVMLEPLENQLFDVAGRFHSRGDQQQFALVIGGKAVSLGIAKRTGAGLTLKPFAREGWLNAELENFPTPLKQIGSSQP